MDGTYRIIADECDDFTTLALQSGFYDHSHFTAAFRAEFGITPYTLRELLHA